MASLAGELAMSRSAFAARFTELVDEPVMHYVAAGGCSWRSTRSRGRRHRRRARDRLGYRSEAAFARAFKRVIGLTPGAVKRAQHIQAQASAGLVRRSDVAGYERVTGHRSDRFGNVP